MNRFIKIIASKLPKKTQQELKKLYFSYQIKKNNFVSDEKEFTKLKNWVHADDWVIDVGANVGHYTKKLSEIVGSEGRVIAFEPMMATFELLASNVAKFSTDNVTLLNVAASDSSTMQGMLLPKFDTGLDNYYMAKITTSSPSFQILCISIDSLDLPNSVSLVKIDAEGHDLKVLEGMKATITKDHPVLLIEESSMEIERFLTNFGYTSERLHGSHNKVFKFQSD